MEFTGRDAARFLGVKGEPDATLLARLADAAARVRAAAAPAWTAKLLPLRADGDALDFGDGAHLVGRGGEAFEQRRIRRALHAQEAGGVPAVELHARPLSPTPRRG